MRKSNKILGKLNPSDFNTNVWRSRLMIIKKRKFEKGEMREREKRVTLAFVKRQMINEKKGWWMIVLNMTHRLQ